VIAAGRKEGGRLIALALHQIETKHSK
jgi:hypothetical protein